MRQNLLWRFLGVTLCLLTFACSGDTGAASDAAVTEFQQGTHYQQVREIQKAADPQRILVEEVFWYGCSHCYAFEPYIEAWAAKRPDDVDFERLPASLGRAVGEAHARLYYTEQVLGLSPQLHKAVFEAIQLRNLLLQQPQQIAGFFNAQTGVMPDLVSNTFDGFAVDAQARRAANRIRAYGITSVPTVVVGGKYYTNGSMSGSLEAYVRCIDALVRKVREERQQGA